MTIGQEQLDNWFTYHPPLAGQGDKYTELRAAGKTMAEAIVRLTPPSADQTAAIRLIRIACEKLVANAAIACGGK